MDQNLRLRRELIAHCRQIVVKAGTRLLTDPARFRELIAGIAFLRQRNFKVMLVSSGAVGTGMRALGLAKRPRQLSEVQALAAIGQGKLMALYDAECRKFGFQTAQLLLTASDLRSRSRYINVMNCINALWERGVLPIVNENDSVSVAELKFGDNDTLAGMLTSLTGAQLTVLLTTVDGLLGRNSDGSLGERIPVVAKITDKIRSLAGGTDDSDLSTGGMASKLRAAGLSTASGAWLWIADGRMDDIMQKIVDGEDTGTLFLPEEHKVPGRKRWFGFFSKISGEITVDSGAQHAVCRNGSSLLPSGVIRIDGEFKRGDTVDVCDADGRPFARGLVNFDSADCRRIMGRHSVELPEILGTSAEAELIHRDNLILLER